MNKFLALMVAFLFAAAFSNAQTTTGSQTLGVSFGIQESKATNMPAGQNTTVGPAFNGKVNNYSFGPSYSFFVANNLDLGVALTFSSLTQTDDNNNFGYPLRYTDYQFNSILYLRKYFLFQNKFGVRVGPYIEYGKSSINYYYSLTDNTNNSIYNNHNADAGIQLELVYIPTKRFGFSANLANLQYEHSTSTGTSELNQNANSLSFYGGTSALQFSVFYIFGGKG